MINFQFSIQISHFQLDDFENPSITSTKEDDEVSNGSTQADEAQPSLSGTGKQTDADGLQQFFVSEVDNVEDEQGLTGTIGDFNDEESEDSAIKPIYRSEGTKVYYIPAIISYNIWRSLRD